MQAKTLDQHISISTDVRGGKPCIAGRRIAVADVAIWHERLGQRADEIATNHEVTLADVYAALAYSFDHRADVDRSIRERVALAEELKRQILPKVAFQQWT